MKPLVGPRNHVLDPQWEGAIFGSCPGHSKALAIFAANGIIQSSMTSCSRRGHSICQASTNSILKISGHSQCGLLAAKGVMGLHSTGDINDCLVFHEI